MQFQLYKWFVYFIVEQLFELIKSPLKTYKQYFKKFVVSLKTKSKKINSAYNIFLQINSSTWKKQITEEKKSLDNNKKYVLVEGFVNHPGYFLINLIAGKYLMDVYRLPGAGLLPKPDPKQELLFQSYGINIFYYMSDRNYNFFDKIRYGLWSINLLKKIIDIDLFLNLKINGINIGKAVYDHYLRMSGVGTVEHLTKELFSGMVNALSYYNFSRDLFRNNSFPVFVQSEKQFVPYSIVFQSALKAGGVVYARGGGPTSFTLRKYDNINQVYMNTFRFDRKLYDYVYKNYRGQAVKLGGDIIRKRFAGDSGPNDIPDAALAFKKDQAIIQREELCDRFGWDVKRPIVGILANNLTDGVFTNRWALFRDNLQWLRQTLKFVRKINEVNWFVKPHPSDIRNKVKTDTKGEYLKWAKYCKHVQFLPEDVGSSSLPEIVDVVLTARGSAGLEYSCFGIPCILGGESLYSGLGFTYEPQSLKEYFDLLMNIHKIPSLEIKKVNRAKIFAYIYLILSRVETDFIPVFSMFKDYDEEKLWNDSSMLIKENDYKNDRLRKMIKIQVHKNCQHLLNYDWIGLS